MLLFKRLISFRLENELSELPKSISKLRMQLQESETCLAELQARHAELIQQAATKMHTIAIEKRVHEVRSPSAYVKRDNLHSLGLM